MKNNALLAAILSSGMSIDNAINLRKPSHPKKTRYAGQTEEQKKLMLTKAQDKRLRKQMRNMEKGI